jgi:hypothetical protein
MNVAKNLWSCAGHSVPGGAHIQAGLPCQDFFALTDDLRGRRVVALADGAGSAKCCQIGARLAVETLISAIANHPGSLRDITDAAALEFGMSVRNELVEKSKAEGNEIGDYACTLLAAAFEDGYSYFWQVGDGAWIVETTNGIDCATWPYKGEFNNQTVFITSDDWADLHDDPVAKLQFVHLDNVVGAMGFTDGLEMFCLDAATQKPHLPFVERIFSALRSQPTESEITLRVEQMLTSPVITQREDDDLTLVLVWKNTTNAPR